MPVAATQSIPDPKPVQKRPLVSSILGTYLATSMGAAISLLLPIIAREMGYSASQVAWIISGFLLARVSLLKVGGSLCNAWGAARVFFVGMSIFTLASLGCSFVDDADYLIAMRIMQGVGAALLSPSSLLLLEDSVPEQKKTWALGLWSMAGVAGLGLAPLLGGFIIEAYGWHAVFLFCTVCAVLLVLACLPSLRTDVPKGGEPAFRAKDVLVSALLVTAFLLIEKEPIEYISIAAGASLVLLWVVRPKVHASSRGLILASLPAVIGGIASFVVVAAIMLWASYFIQYDLALSSVVFGLGCAAFGVTGAISCEANDRFLARKRYDKSFVVAGLLIVLIAASAFLAEHYASLWLALAVLMLAGIVYGYTNSTISGAMLAAFPVANSGGGASTASLSKQFGQLIGVMIFAVYRDVAATHTGTSPTLFAIFAACGIVLLVVAGMCHRTAGGR